jgi:hypothetical protein
MLVRPLFFLFAAVLALPARADSNPCPAGKTRKNSAGDSVFVCTQVAASRPLVRLPADVKTAAQATLHGAFAMPNGALDGLVFFSANAKSWAIVDAAGKPLTMTSTGLPEGLHAPTNRIIYSLYEVVGTPGAGLKPTFYGKATPLVLKSVKALAEVDGCLFDSYLLGTWVAQVSTRLPKDKIVSMGPLTKYFDPTKKVPVHITLSKAQARPALDDYRLGKKISDAATMILSGVIDNFDNDVTDGGKSYPALSKLGAANPFLGASSGAVELYRLGNMHGVPGDSHWVLTYPPGTQNTTGNGMSFLLASYAGPFWAMKAGAGFSTIQILPHLPYVKNGLEVALQALSIGKQAAACK